MSIGPPGVSAADQSALVKIPGPAAAGQASPGSGAMPPAR